MSQNENELTIKALVIVAVITILVILGVVKYRKSN